MGMEKLKGTKYGYIDRSYDQYRNDLAFYALMFLEEDSMMADLARYVGIGLHSDFLVTNITVICSNDRG